MDLDKILSVASRGGASDIILKAKIVPKFRFNGSLVPLQGGSFISHEDMQRWVAQVLPSNLRNEMEESGEVDFSYQQESGQRFRVSLFRQKNDYGMVLRVISNHIKTLEELQLPDILSNFAFYRNGLVLLTGATGSGKSTSLAAIVEKINREQSSHIITIEDPIEFEFVERRCTINQREVGRDTKSFSGALRAALRQNPDVILVGELRDKETIETALMAAETGHLVLSTLHTSDAVETISRIFSYFQPHEHNNIRMILASALKAIVSQRLIARSDQKRQLAASEILVVNDRVKQFFLEAQNFEGLFMVMRESTDSGMQTFDQSLMNLYRQGMIRREEALKHCSNSDNMRLQMSGVS